MLYITDSKHISDIPDEINDGDSVVIFCRETDTIRVLELNSLLSAAKTVPVRFEAADTKEEQLLAIGGMLEHEDVCTILFPVSQVPKRYADKIKTVRRAARKRSSEKKTGRVRKSRKTAETNTPAAAEDMGHADDAESVLPGFPKPEGAAEEKGEEDMTAKKEKGPETAAHTDDPFRTETAHKEQEAARKKAGCGENDWWAPQESLTRKTEDEDARRKAREELLARADAAMAEAGRETKA